MREMMTVPKPKLVVVELPATNPLPEPDVAAQKMQFTSQLLGRAFGALKQVLRPIKGNLEVEIDRLRLEWKQQAPLWESKMLLKACDQAVSTVIEFLSTLALGVKMRQELGPIIDLAERHVQVRREEAAVMSDIENIDQYMAQLRRARRTWGELATLTTECQNWEAIARVSVGRLFRATQTVVMDYELLRVNAALEVTKATLTKLRTADSPIASDLSRLHGQSVEILGEPLPLLTLTWPASNGDPFAGPTLA